MCSEGTKKLTKRTEKEGARGKVGCVCAKVSCKEYEVSSSLDKLQYTTSLTVISPSVQSPSLTVPSISTRVPQPFLVPLLHIPKYLLSEFEKCVKLRKQCLTGNLNNYISIWSSTLELPHASTVLAAPHHSKAVRHEIHCVALVDVTICISEKVDKWQQIQ